MDLSVIIPVFNTDSILFKKCLNSLIFKNNINYEIIVVDDGSKNKNSIIYKKIINKIDNNRIKYFYKVNSGVSSTRNFGISKAQGKYIMFVDSDDYIDPSVIDISMLNGKNDIVVFDMVYTNYKKIKIYSDFNENDTISKKIVLQNFILYGSFHSPCSKLYKRENILNNKILFDSEYMQGEDALFNLNYILSDNFVNIEYHKDNLYYYNLDLSTLDGRWIKNKTKMLDNFLTIFKIKLNVIKKYLDNNQDFINILKYNYLNVLFQSCMKLVNITKLNDKIFNDIKDSVDLFEIKSKNIKYNVEFFLIKNKCTFVIKLISFIRKIYIKFIKNKL